MPIMHSILQAARAGLPPWRLTRAFTASEDEALAANSGDDNLTARAGGPTAFALRLPVGLVHGDLARAHRAVVHASHAALLLSFSCC